MNAINVQHALDIIGVLLAGMFLCTFFGFAFVWPIESRRPLPPPRPCPNCHGSLVLSRRAGAWVHEGVCR